MCCVSFTWSFVCSCSVTFSGVLFWKINRISYSFGILIGICFPSLSSHSWVLQAKSWYRGSPCLQTKTKNLWIHFTSFLGFVYFFLLGRTLRFFFPFASKGSSTGAICFSVADGKKVLAELVARSESGNSFQCVQMLPVHKAGVILGTWLKKKKNNPHSECFLFCI